MLTKLLLCGILAILLGYGAGFLVSNMSPINDLPIECKSWNKNYAMEKSLFLVGVMMCMLFMKYNFLISIC